LPRAELQALNDELRALLDTYIATRFGIPFREAEQRLKTKIESITTPIRDSFFTLSRNAQKNADEGRFAAANGPVEELQKKVAGTPRSKRTTRISGP
jgi:hypothetical protein